MKLWCLFCSRDDNEQCGSCHRIPGGLIIEDRLEKRLLKDDVWVLGPKKIDPAVVVGIPPRSLLFCKRCGPSLCLVLLGLARGSSRHMHYDPLFLLGPLAVLRCEVELRHVG